MRKLISAILVIATLAPTASYADWNGHRHYGGGGHYQGGGGGDAGAALFGGIVGGLILGGMINSMNQPQYQQYPQPYYYLWERHHPPQNHHPHIRVHYHYLEQMIRNPIHSILQLKFPILFHPDFLRKKKEAVVL